MYLNRRTHLEAWDIELSFRRLSERLKRGTASTIIVCVAFVFSAAFTSDIEAQEIAVTPPAAERSLPSNEDARSTVTEIYDGSELVNTLMIVCGRPKESEAEEVEELDSDLFERSVRL